MERRLAVTYIVTATATFGIGCVAIAAAGGGLFASAAPKPAGGKQIEVVDDYIVIHSSTTLAAGEIAVAPADPVAESADSPRAAIARSQPATTTGQPAAPDAAPIAVPVAVPVPLSADPTPAPPPAPAPVAAEPEPTEPPEAPQPPAAALPAPAPAAPATTVPAARPPIPAGCENPEWRNGHWNCDDD